MNHFFPCKAEVIKDYRSKYSDPLIIRTGEELSVKQRDTQWQSFLWCVNQNGKGGWVPEDYLSVSGDIAVANCDYSAAELNANLGELITVEIEAGGWFWCCDQSGRYGWIPAENIKIAE